MENTKEKNEPSAKGSLSNLNIQYARVLCKVS